VQEPALVKYTDDEHGEVGDSPGAVVATSDVLLEIFASN